MTSKSYEFGSLGGAIYERFSSNGPDSPRKPFIAWNPYSRNHVYGQSSNIGRTPYIGSPHVEDQYLLGWYAGSTCTYPAGALLLSALVDKWKDSDLNLGVSLAESGESLGMVVNGLGNIYQSARSIRRGDLNGALRHMARVPSQDIKKAKRHLSQGDTSATWLSLHLGWSPLISDVYAYSKGLSVIPKYEVLRTQWVNGSGSVVWNFVSNLKSKSRVQSRLVAKITSGPTILDRLGLTNPALIAWELVPLSFVADYFLPIGEYINALSAYRIKTEELYRQDRANHYATCSRGKDEKLPVGPAFNPWYSVRSGSAYISDNSYSRYKTTVTGLLVPKTISIDVPTSLTRVATMASLAHQALIGLRR